MRTEAGGPAPGGDLDTLLAGWLPTIDDARIDVRAMFGAQAYLANGKMFAAVGPMGLLLKLPADVRQALLDAGEASPFSPHPGASFGEWIALPAAVPNAAEAEKLLALVRQSLDYVRQARPAARPPREQRRFRKRQF